MFSIGTDIIEVSRIQKSMENANFISRYFGRQEQQLFEARREAKSLFQTIAANFAAKEAFSKALGTGVAGFLLKEVEVLRDEMDAPYLALTGKAAELAGEKELSFSVSLSHTEQYATAVVLAYNEGDRT